MRLPQRYSDLEAAPLLCAGLIGYRTLRMAGGADFRARGALVPAALRAVDKGGIVVCGGIHMSEIPGFPYAWLWGERRIASVANLTRADAVEFMRIAAAMPLQVETVRNA